MRLSKKCGEIFSNNHRKELMISWNKHTKTRKFREVNLNINYNICNSKYKFLVSLKTFSNFINKDLSYTKIMGIN